MRFWGCSRHGFALVFWLFLLCLNGDFKILEWGGRGMLFVKIEEWYVGFGLFDIHKCWFVDHQNTKQRWPFGKPCSYEE